MPEAVRVGRPSPATIKRLFGMSGNRCAFPRCSNRLVTEAGILAARVCHIKAQSAGGPRYDPAQTEGERHAFANLILLCPIHSDVVDADVEAYTVERLTKMKADHESRTGPQVGASDELVRQILATAVGGSVIVSNNQLGGQVAHSITNIGRMPRRIDAAAAARIVLAVSGYAGQPVEVRAMLGDADSIELARRIMEILELAGWHPTGVDQVVMSKNPDGVVVHGAESELPIVTVLGNALLTAGLKTQGWREKESGIKVTVGPALS